MGKLPWLLATLLFVAGSAFAQKAPLAPDNEPKSTVTVRSPHSMDGDRMVPLCPAQFHDSLRTDGMAGPHDRDVAPPKIKKNVPAKMTLAAIAESNKIHTGNYIVILDAVVNANGAPANVCLRKSSGFGLDAAAASAVTQYRFVPATRNGKPVRMRIPVEVRFENPEVGMLEDIQHVPARVRKSAPNLPAIADLVPGTQPQIE